MDFLGYLKKVLNKCKITTISGLEKVIQEEGQKCPKKRLLILLNPEVEEIVKYIIIKIFSLMSFPLILYVSVLHKARICYPMLW